MGKRVIFWSFGPENDASSQYRLRMPAQVLIDQGADIRFDAKGPVVLWNRQWRGPRPPSGVLAIALNEVPEADIIVMQRPHLRYWADVIPMVQKLGIRVVVDIDDLFDRIHKDNPAHRAFDPNVRADDNQRWTDKACELADVVTCTTPLLKDRYGYGHGIVLPNLVPERYLATEAPGKRPQTLGWSGSVETHPDDLQVTQGAVRDVLDEYGWGFHVVGTGVGVQEALKLSEPPSTSEGWVPFANYSPALAEMEVGIVPLADTKFNHGKSCLKLAELSSLGIPTVASPTYDNLRLHKLGIGEIAKHPGQWYQRLTRLVADKDYREDVAGRSKAAMASMTYERLAHQWADAWGLE